MNDEDVAWARARALAALGSGERVAAWLEGKLVCPEAPAGWRGQLERAGLWPWVPPAEAGPVLLVKGRIGGPRVAVVGARAVDGYGAAVARRVAVDVVRLGGWVVSGGAEGCDAAAHEGALAEGGGTIVVLGGGHGRPFPAGHRALFERVVAGGGAVVSAYWPDVPPGRHRFLARNRVIAALSEAVVVARAARRSGSLSTARWAKTLGREVFAVPGDVGEALSAGPHGLLEEGATPLVSAGGLARVVGVEGERLSAGEWPVGHAGSVAPWREDVVGAGALAWCGDDEVAGAVVEALRVESGLDLDTMVMRTGVPVDAVASALLDLELGGLIQRLAGDRFALTARS